MSDPVKCPECQRPMADGELDLGLCAECYYSHDDDDYYNDGDGCCTHCRGDGWDDECHEEGCYCLQGHPCGACGGSGLAKDQTIW